MTSLSTLFAAILTPFLTKILAGAFVPINALELLVSTVQAREEARLGQAKLIRWA